MNDLRVLALALCAAILCESPADAQPAAQRTPGPASEVGRIVARLLPTPAISPAAGFTARVIVPPGQAYDPVDVRMRGTTAFLTDEGGQEGSRGGRLLTVDASGRLGVRLDVDALTPVIGFDLAPASVAPHPGTLYALAQAQAGWDGGADAAHVILRIDPDERTVVVLCTLPAAGRERAPGSMGALARFGPDGSPFAGRFFALAAGNYVVYQVAPDGRCTPFAALPAPYYGPTGIAFSADGETMLLSASTYDPLAGAAQGRPGVVLRVRADGTVDPKPLVEGLAQPTGLAVAPPEFGTYGGQLFVADAGRFEMPVPMTQALQADGAVYWVGPDGALAMVASGFINPLGLQFDADRLWVTDIAGDFTGGRRELPDGFVVEIRPRR